jgi:hypothetical protein
VDTGIYSHAVAFGQTWVSTGENVEWGGESIQTGYLAGIQYSSPIFKGTSGELEVAALNTLSELHRAKK